MSVYKQLKIFRKSLALNQVEFAKKLGIAQSYYTKIENGKRPINDAILEKFSVLSNQDFEALKQLNKDADLSVSIKKDIKKISPAGLEKISNFVRFIKHQEGIG